MPAVDQIVRDLPPELRNCVFQYDDSSSPLESFLIVYFPFKLGQSFQADKMFKLILSGHHYNYTRKNLYLIGPPDDISLHLVGEYYHRDITKNTYPFDVIGDTSLSVLVNLPVDLQCKLGNLATIHHLHSIHKHPLGVDESERATRWASKHGHLEVVQYLRLHAIAKYFSSEAMDLASENGHLEVVKYLHSIGQKCTKSAMNKASENGHLEVVQYLHSIGAKCTDSAIHYAKENKHLEVVKYLRFIGKESKIDRFREQFEIW